MAVATRPAARRGRPGKRRRYIGAGSRESDLQAIAQQQASRQGSAAPGREGREDRRGRRPRREAPAPASPARFEVPPSEEEAEPSVATPLDRNVERVADADEVLAYEFVAGIVEELPEEAMPESRDEIEEEAEDLARLAETLRAPLFGSVPKALLARARGVIARRQGVVSDLLHELRYEPADDELGEEVAPGLFETADGRLVDEQGVVYADADADMSEIGPVLIDEDGNRYHLDDGQGLIPLSAPAPERDEQGRFLPRDRAEATVSDAAATQRETERDEEQE